MTYSIIIPVYNVERYLVKCLDSIVNQLYKNYEVIIVCDKCSDNSEKIVDKYVGEYGFIKLYYENTGLSKARNIGVNESKGDYIVFLDSDDFLEHDFLEVINNNLYDKPDLLRFQVQDVTDEKIIKYVEKPFDTLNGVDAFSKIINYHYIENAWSYIYKASFYKKNKFEFLEGCLAEDYGLVPLIIAKSKKVKSISYIGYNYVQRDNSLMNNNDYNKKLKKMNDMIIQSDILKDKLSDIKDNYKFISFINNSLIYYSTTLKYKDYLIYNKLLKSKKCFDHLKGKDIKSKIKYTIIKLNSYFFYRYLVRFL